MAEKLLKSLDFGTGDKYYPSVQWEYVEGKPTIPTKTSELQNDSNFLTEHQSLDEYSKQSDLTNHNTSNDSHNDIRLLIEGLTTRLNALANSDDTTLDQMAEIVAYIKNNKSLIEGITTSKVNVSDIIDNLTTSVANKPLSAKQGVALKGLIDTLTSAVNGKAPQDHTHSQYLTELPSHSHSEYATAAKVNELFEEIDDLKAQLGTQEIESVSYTDGKYIASDGSVASSSSLCMVEAHGLIPNKKLHCTLWIDPNTYGNTAVGYDANGTYVVGSDGFSWTALGNDVYECTIPTNVEILKFNIYKTQKETMVCYMLGEEDYKYIPSYITHSVAKPLEFVSGKKLVAFGDSITFGIQSKIDANGNTSQANDEVNQYIKLFCNKLGLILTNKAISGTTLVNVAHPTETSLTADKSIYNQVITTNLSTYDYILIAGGCNDAVLQRTLGTIGGNDNTTVYGALELMCQYIQSNKKANAQVIFLTPIPLLRTLTIPLETYRNAVFEVAVKYGFNVVDGYKLGFPYEVSDYSKIVFPDGCHPSIAGHKMYANSLLGVLVGEMGMSTETWTFTLADGSTVTKEVYLK